MPTEIETQVLRWLSAIEVMPDTATRVMELGPDAITVVCEAAVGAYPGLRTKVRTNAVSLLGWMDVPQARETVVLLIHDPLPDVATRALRAAGRQHNAAAVTVIEQRLASSSAPPLVAAEAVKALDAIASDDADAALDSYRQAGASAPPHRHSAVVTEVLDRTRRQR